MNDLKTLGFHHISMVSTDATRTLAFYGGVLGLCLVKRTVDVDDPGACHLYLSNQGGEPGTILTFFERPGARRGHWGVGGIHHLALGVDTAEAQLKWKRHLEDAGIPVTGPLDRGYFKSIYFNDPDGQILEIATLGPGYAIDEPADQLGHTLVQPPADRLPEGRDEWGIATLTHPAPVPSVTEDMTLRGIHHITGITGELSEAHDFYAGLLGLPLVKRTLNQDDGRTEHWFWARYDGDRVGPHSAMTLFGWPGSRFRARPGAGQPHHVAFRARDEDEQRGWQDHLRSHGVETTEILDRSYFRSIYFRAPDGLLVELATDGPGFDIDEPDEVPVSELKLPRWLEPRREQIEAALTLATGAATPA